MSQACCAPATHRKIPLMKLAHAHGARRVTTAARPALRSCGVPLMRPLGAGQARAWRAVSAASRSAAPRAASAAAASRAASAVSRSATAL
jgi:hypothetical protein